MAAGNCPTYTVLAKQVEAVLGRLVDLTRAQCTAFERGNHREFMELDKLLELAIGEKERTVGALREHAKEHGCQP